MRSSIGLAHPGERFVFSRVCVCLRVYVVVCVLYTCVICSRPEHPESCGCPGCCPFQMSWWGHYLGRWAQWTWTRRRWPRRTRARRRWAEGGFRSLLHLCCEKHTSTNRFHWNHAWSCRLWQGLKDYILKAHCVRLTNILRLKKKKKHTAHKWTPIYWWCTAFRPWPPCNISSKCRTMHHNPTGRLNNTPPPA